MTAHHLPYFIPATVLLAFMIGDSWWRFAGSVALAALLYVAMIEPMSRPKPARIEMFDTLDKAEVSYFEGDEATGIYIVTGRRSYTLPWSEQTMRGLHEASQRAEAEGGTVRLAEPREGSAGGEWSAEWAPPPAPAPKG